MKVRLGQIATIAAKKKVKLIYLKSNIYLKYQSQKDANFGNFSNTEQLTIFAKFYNGNYKKNIIHNLYYNNWYILHKCK